MKKKFAIFASGAGTNAQEIFNYFAENEHFIIDSLWSNSPNAHALIRAGKHGIYNCVFNRQQFYETDEIERILKNRKVDLIVLAGFLWLIPPSLIRNFPIINIHPGLLPKYGGKGMYGMNVHKAVVKNKEQESGISIHYVNEKFDDGKIIFQAKCPVLPDDTPEQLAQKVHELEYKHFPRVIEKVLSGL